METNNPKTLVYLEDVLEIMSSEKKRVSKFETIGNDAKLAMILELMKLQSKFEQLPPAKDLSEELEVLDGISLSKMRDGS